jgi:hypothetical protein
MMKFFRKHNKKLLAVFMVLLMVVFLGGSALDNLLQPDLNRVVANSNVGEISYFDHRLAEDTTFILEAVGLDWKRPLPGVAEPLDTIEWILLTREAKKLGMGSDSAMVRSTLAGAVGIDELSRRLRRKPERILTAFAEFDSVQRAAQAVGGATAPSEAQVVTAARTALEKVRINTVLLPAGAFVQEDAEFTESRIAEQFEEYREREPGRGLEFGYYLPDAVQVEYIRIDRDAIAEEFRATRVKRLARKAEAYYGKRRETDPAFRRTPEETGDDSEEPVEGPPYEPPPYLSWDDARDIAMNVVSKQEADEAVAQLAGWLDQRFSEHWLGAETDEGGYKQAPETVTGPGYYHKVLERIPPTIAFPDAVSIGTTGFFSADEADDVPVLGKASYLSERGGVEQLRTLAFRTKSIIPVLPNKKGLNPSDYLALFQTCRYVLTDADGGAFLFRVIDGRNGHIPESVDEVRERVVKDLRTLQAYETARARAESLRGCSAGLSLQESYDSDEELRELLESAPEGGGGYFEPPPFARASRFQAMLGGARGPVFVGSGVGSLPPDAVQRCFALEHAPEKTAVIEFEDEARIMVVEWQETQPAQGDDFLGMREQFVQQMARARSRGAVSDWLKPEQIRARNGFKLVSN